MKRFTENPTKMSPYITDDLREIIKIIYKQKRRGPTNSNIHVQILVTGTHIIRTNITLEIIGIVCLKTIRVFSV